VVRRHEEEESVAESIADVVEHRTRPKRRVTAVRTVDGPEQQRECKGRQVRYTKCKVVVREGISEL